jgi:hypothetical protein
MGPNHIRFGALDLVLREVSKLLNVDVWVCLHANLLQIIKLYGEKCNID